ncbi:unnamed protein product [Didymodactylos carnosus]|nr:unnamed protein product [Didymodactylos carnosus]CAF4010521.1 unnamed protein product [Didymodactylos carnosus]
MLTVLCFQQLIDSNNQMDSAIPIKNYCDTLKQQGQTISITQLKLLFGTIVDDLNKNNRLCINQVISTIDNNVDVSKLADGTLVNHELILLIRDTFISLLNSNEDNNNNVLEQTKMIKILFLNTSFIETIKIALVTIATNGAQHNILLTLEKLIDGLKISQIKQIDLQDDDVLLQLIEPILNITDSIHYYISFNDQIRRDYCIQHSLLLDYIINILTCKTFVNEMIVKTFSNNVITPLMVYALVYLYGLTFDVTLLTLIKDKQLTMDILNSALTNCKSIQFDAYRTLAMIMNENDVKTLSNSAEIIKLFINYIKLYIDNLLREKLQQRVLEILWSMTFNEKAANILTNDQHFMKHVKLLSTTSKGVQKTAEGIIWKLEKKDEHHSTQSLPNKYKYDVMINYSHTDKNLCYQIHERLVNDKFCVLFDRDHCYGSHMQEMANAIENAEFVLVCMSDSYKQSAYCQSEAHYAYERQCRLIPLIVREKYRPDGWLGFIISGKIYIDFPEFSQFDEAYQKLLSEINYHRKNQSQTTKHQPITHYTSITPQESSK